MLTNKLTSSAKTATPEAAPVTQASTVEAVIHINRRPTLGNRLRGGDPTARPELLAHILSWAGLDSWVANSQLKG